MPVRQIRRRSLAALAVLSLALPAAAQVENGFAGAYLAARHASAVSDFKTAAQYYTQALARDPSNQGLLESALVSFVGLGQVDQAVPVARRLAQVDISSQVAQLVLLADQLKRGDYDAVLTDFEAGRSVGSLIDVLIRAWAHFGAGQMVQALDSFDAASREPGVASFAAYHKALALAAVGDFEGAAGIFEGDRGLVLRATRRGAIAYAQVLSQLERNDAAMALIDESFGLDLDPGLAAFRERLAAGEAIPFTMIRNAGDGAAEVYFTVASALSGEAADAFTLVYSRLAEHLRPDHADAILLTARLLESQRQYDLASKAYRRVPADSTSFFSAELGRAETLQATGKSEAAIEVLEQLARLHPDVAMVHVTLGDMLSRLKRYPEATRAYDSAVALFRGDDAEQWGVYFARAVSHERQGDWEAAEADFLKALALEPGQPQVLNYLGYSYVERGENLDQALDMIERAVAARPDSGYITDSLGWVLYRLGRYDEAVAPMERAVELLPIDPVMNDHLGDVLWAVGRRNEARFQWKRALSFYDPADPTPDFDPERVRRKLEVGLDTVLEEEGAKPISVANGD